MAGLTKEERALLVSLLERAVDDDQVFVGLRLTPKGETYVPLDNVELDGDGDIILRSWWE